MNNSLLQNDPVHPAAEVDLPSRSDPTGGLGATDGSPMDTQSRPVYMTLAESVLQSHKNKEAFSADLREKQDAMKNLAHSMLVGAYKLGIKAACDFVLQLPPDTLATYRAIASAAAASPRERQ